MDAGFKGILQSGDAHDGRRREKRRDGGGGGGIDYTVQADKRWDRCRRQPGQGWILFEGQ